VSQLTCVKNEEWKMENENAVLPFVTFPTPSPASSLPLNTCPTWISENQNKQHSNKEQESGKQTTAQNL